MVSLSTELLCREGVQTNILISSKYLTGQFNGAGKAQAKNARFMALGIRKKNESRLRAYFKPDALKMVIKRKNSFNFVFTHQHE
jgi:hypothetical protein